MPHSRRHSGQHAGVGVLWHRIFVVVDPQGDFFLNLYYYYQPQYLKKQKQKHTTFYDLETVTLQSPGRHLGLIEEGKDGVCMSESWAWIRLTAKSPRETLREN